MRSTPAALTLVLALAAGPSLHAHPRDELPSRDAALNVERLVRRRRATLHHSPVLKGTPTSAGDSREKTRVVLSTDDIAWLEIHFAEPVTIHRASVLFGDGTEHRWDLLVGDTPEQLRPVLERDVVQPGQWSRVHRFERPLRFRVARLEMQSKGGGPVDLAEVALVSRQVPIGLTLDAPGREVCRGSILPAVARIHYDGGYADSGSLGLGLEVPPRGAVSLRPTPLSGDTTAMILFAATGRSPVRAVLEKGTARMESAPLHIEATEVRRPDWSVTCVERLPRHRTPRPGGKATWRIHVRNVGNCTLPRAAIEVRTGGTVLHRSFVEGLDRFDTAFVDVDHPHDGTSPVLEVVVNPGGQYGEEALANNRLTVDTAALRVGLWMERPLGWALGRAEAAFGQGTSCMEDWAQRQVRRVNDLLAASVHPGLPDGVTARLALDQVVEVPEDALPLWGGRPSSDPDLRDDTVDIPWGMPTSRIDEGLFDRADEQDDFNPLWFDTTSAGVMLEHMGLADPARGDVRADDVDPALGATLDRDKTGLVHRSARDGFGPTNPDRPLSEHDAKGLQRLVDTGRTGRGGAYLADLPRSCLVRVLGADGTPRDGVEIRAWRRTLRADGRRMFGGDPVRSGLTASGGYFDLSDRGRDPWFDGTGEVVDARRSLLLVSVRHGDRTRWRWLDTSPWNLGFWRGEKEQVRVDLSTDL